MRIKKLDRIQALAQAKTFDPITYDEFLSGLGNTPLAKIKQQYGDVVTEDTQDYFRRHPSERFLWIQNRCVGPEPVV